MSTIVSYIGIARDYTEAKFNNVRHGTVNELKNYIRDHPDLTVFEVLQTPIRKMYFDIENIPADQPDLINTIITNLIEYAGIAPDTPYTLTHNAHSRHPGLSYHVIFPLKMDVTNLYNLVCGFKIAHINYVSYIDSSVYNHNWRLFRLPGQRGVIKPGVPYDVANRNDDRHEIVRGTFDDAIIQAIDTVPTHERIFDSMPDVVVRHADNKGPMTSDEINQRYRHNRFGNGQGRWMHRDGRRPYDRGNGRSYHKRRRDEHVSGTMRRLFMIMFMAFVGVVVAMCTEMCVRHAITHHWHTKVWDVIVNDFISYNRLPFTLMLIVVGIIVGNDIYKWTNGDELDIDDIY